MSRLEEEADDIVSTLKMLAAEPSESATIAKKNTRVTHLTREARRFLQQTDQNGIKLLWIQQSPNDFSVSVDSGASFFDLPRKLGTLLLILAMDLPAAVGEQSLLPWKSKSQIVQLFKSEMGMVLAESAVAQLVHRLRKAIGERGNANPYLVQTNASGEYRFALERGGLVSEGDRMLSKKNESD